MNRMYDRYARRSAKRLAGALLLVFLMAGCSSAIRNKSLSEGSLAPAYDFDSRLPENDSRLFVVLAFSGGGTRAAAFSYGVLDALRNTPLVIDDQRMGMIDQVDVISAVSGGSYTAAYYGLFGDRLFEDFKERFLERNWPQTYGWMLANPVNLARLMSEGFNRSDLMARFLNDKIFDGKTFADLSVGSRPFIIINATDLNNSLTFSFIQQQFDLLCSDLNSYPVANAVMASSSVPPAFAPVRLRNYPGCKARDKPWISQALQARQLLSRRFVVAQGLSRYRDQETMPFVNLADGGVTDNIGVSGSMMSPVTQHGNVRRMAGAFSDQALDRVEKVLVILVNAQVYRPYPWAISGEEPGAFNTLKASFDAAFNTLTTLNIAQARREFMAWGENINRRRPPARPPVKVYFSTLTFNQIENPARQEKFNALPTAALDSEEVDALTALGSELLNKSESFKSFLLEVRDLSGN